MDFNVKNETISTNVFWDFKGHFDFVDHWFLMGTPYPIFFIWVSYLIFVLKLGPEFMKKRPAFNLNNILAIYNIAQVALSFYMFCIGLQYLWQHGVIHSACLMKREDILKYVTGCNHVYLLAKMSELLDTIFFVLRKKQRQVTFLHVYHHSLMVLISWFTLKYDPTDSPVFMGTLNSFVHIVMYSYYGLSTFPQIAKYLWWKKYITSMQLIQFVVILIQVIINSTISECPPSYPLFFSMCLNSFLFIYLFGDFYKKSYVKKNEGKITGNNTISNTANINGKDDINEMVNNNGTKTNGSNFTNGRTFNRNKISTFVQ